MTYSLAVDELRDRWLEEWRGSLFSPLCGVPFVTRPLVSVAAVERALADPNAHDCEWLLVITMPHKIVFWTGKFVPCWEGDVERRLWEEQRP